MFELEPGPLARLDERTLRPFPLLPSFEGLVAGALDPARSVDDGLAQQRTNVGGDGAPDLDGAYSATVGIAADVVAGQVGAEDDQVAGALVDTTAGAEAYRGQALPHLPQPSVPIEGDYVDPPKPDGLPPDEGGADTDRQRN